jgi:hypothetical protein
VSESKQLLAATAVPMSPIVGQDRGLSLLTLMPDLLADYGHPWPGEDAGTKAHREWMLARITVADRLNQQMTKAMMRLPNTTLSGPKPAAGSGYARKDGSVVHLCPSDGEGAMPCCGLTPFEVPPTDRLTSNSQLVTCKPNTTSSV